MALGAIELVDSSGIVLNPKGAAIQPSVPQGPGALEKMSPMESMQEVFFDIRDGITNLGDIFKEKISGLNSHLAFRLETLNKTMSKIGNIAASDLELGKAEFADEQSDQRADDRGKNLGQENVPSAGEEGDGDEKKGMVASLKENYSNLGEKGKIALFGAIAAGLMLAATKLNKIIAPILKFFNETILPAFKRFYAVLEKDIGPVIDKVIDSISDALDGLKEFFQGLIDLDFDKMKKGLKKIYTEALPKFISAVGVAIFSMVDGLLAFLGFEEDGVLRKFVVKVKDFFYDFPEKFKEMFVKAVESVTTFFQDSLTFVTETIPEFFTDMKDKLVQGIKDMISFIVDPIVQLKNDIVDTVDIGIDKIKDGIVSVVTSVKDTFTNFVNGLKGMANAIIDKINLIPGVNIDKLEMTPLSDDKIEVIGETGDATVAEGVALDNRARIEGNKKRALNYTSSMNTVSQGAEGSLDGIISDEEIAVIENMETLRAQKLKTLLDNTLQNQELRANAETSKPIIVANSTKQGDVTNQTSVHSAEPASDHSDLTAKALASAMTP